MQNEFGSEVARLRQQQGLSLRALSERLHEQTGVAIDASGIKRIESGERDPRLSEATALSVALGVPLQDMIERPVTRLRVLEELQAAITDLQAITHEQIAVETRTLEIEATLAAATEGLRALLDSERVRSAVGASSDPTLGPLVELARRMVSDEPEA